MARKRLGKTVEKAAFEAGVNRQLWYLTECGCYSSIPPVIDYYLKQKDQPVDPLDYLQFRLNTQKEFGRKHLVGKGLPDQSLKIPPIEAFRLHCGVETRASFAKGLCIQVALMYKLEHGEAKHLPIQIYDALRIAGLPVDDLEELDERTVEYYECH